MKKADDEVANHGVLDNNGSLIGAVTRYMFVLVTVFLSVIACGPPAPRTPVQLAQECANGCNELRESAKESCFSDANVASCNDAAMIYLGGYGAEPNSELAMVFLAFACVQKDSASCAAAEALRANVDPDVGKDSLRALDIEGRFSSCLNDSLDTCWMNIELIFDEQNCSIKKSCSAVDHFVVDICQNSPEKCESLVVSSGKYSTSASYPMLGRSVSEIARVVKNRKAASPAAVDEQDQTTDESRTPSQSAEELTDDSTTTSQSAEDASLRELDVGARLQSCLSEPLGTCWLQLEVAYDVEGCVNKLSCSLIDHLVADVCDGSESKCEGLISSSETRYSDRSSYSALATMVHDTAKSVHKRTPTTPSELSTAKGWSSSSADEGDEAEKTKTETEKTKKKAKKTKKKTKAKSSGSCPTTAACGCSGRRKGECGGPCCQWYVGHGCSCR